MRLLVILLVVCALAMGCTTVPEQTFNREHSSIRSIAVMPPIYEEEFLLRYRNDQIETVDTISPVPIGRLFAYIAKENREAEFTELATTASSVLADEFRTRLDKELAALSFDLIDATVGPDQDPPRTRYNLLKQLPASAFNGADALLETSGQIGFIAAGRGKPYQPAMWLMIRLTHRDGTTLLQDRIIYNPADSDGYGTMLYPTDAYLFESRDELLDSEKAAEALTEATKIVAKEVAFLLKGPALNVD